MQTSYSADFSTLLPIDTRGYQAGDEVAITELFSTVFRQILTEEHWQWKYTGHNRSTPVVRLGFNANQQLIGHAGAVLLNGWRHGASRPFLQICDVMVHPAMRGQLGSCNIFTRLIRELLESIAAQWPHALVYGFPGLRPFRLGEYVRVYAALETAHSLRNTARRNRLLPTLIYTSNLAWDDARLDRLWAKFATHLPLALIRDRSYLHWRYATHPQHTYQLLGLYLGGYLLGWAVVRIAAQRLLVVDILLARRWLQLGWSALASMAGQLGLDEVEIWLPTAWYKQMRGILNPTPVIVTNMVWRASLPTEVVAQELYYTMGDLDIF